MYYNLGPWIGSLGLNIGKGILCVGEGDGAGEG